MMDQFKVRRAIYPGYTQVYLVLLDEEGYIVGEFNLYSEPNNIRLNQNFR